MGWFGGFRLRNNLKEQYCIVVTSGDLWCNSVGVSMVYAYVVITEKVVFDLHLFYLNSHNYL